MMSDELKASETSAAELADMIDMLMSEGSGHVNIVSQENGDGLKINTVKSTDCGVKGACCQPNETSPDEEE